MYNQPRNYRGPRRALKNSHPFLLPLIVALCLVVIVVGGFFLLRGGEDTAAQPSASASPSSSGSAAKPDVKPSPSPSVSVTPSASPSPSQSASPSPSVSVAPSPSPSPSVSASPSPSPSPSPSVSAKPTPSQSEIGSEVPWYLTLVNNTHPLPNDFKPTVSQLPNGLYFDSRAKDALMDMVNACRAAGLKPVIGSAYRSIDEQIYLHERKIKFYLNDGLSYDEAYTAASRVVAIPGCSEHNLGLAVDLCALSYQILDEGQLKTAEQQWFMEHCHEYGFILRYPLDKTEITGIIFEPWHYRYVGVEVAKEIKETGLALEEYMELYYGIK